MSLDHCRALLVSADPDRLRTAEAAPRAAQALLIPLYALNVEISRAAWASTEPLVAEMRLQWWRDVLAELGQGAPPRTGHPVLETCGFLQGDGAVVAVLDRLVEARRWDIWGDPFAGSGALWDHLESTGGALMWLAARLLGAPDSAESTVRQFGSAAALAAWLRAVPSLTARGRHPLPDPAAAAVSELARQGLDRIAAARRGRGQVPGPALPALLAGWQARPLLALAMKEPARVASGTLALSEFARRGSLTWAALTGRW